VIGFTKNRISQPKIKDVDANIKKILKLEYPNIFNESKSLLFLKLKRYHMLDMKIINGSNLIIILGIYKAVSVIGIIIVVSKFLKNSISSKRLSTIPKQ